MNYKIRIKRHAQYEMLMKKNVLCFLFTLLFSFISSSSSAAIAIWVGESYTCDASSAVMGLTSDVTWSNNDGCVSLNYSGFRCTVVANQYFGGTSTVKCSWKYRLYSGDKWKTQSKTWTFTCRENPVFISPTEMTIATNCVDYVSYFHENNNSQYLSYANVRYNSSNKNVATVDVNGKVLGINPGTCYVTVYSKLSDASKAPSCKVIVRDVDPTNVIVTPNSIDIVRGETEQLTAEIIPHNSTVKTVKWYSNDNSIADINNGQLKALKHGVTSVYCMVNNIKSNEVIVNVLKPNLKIYESLNSGIVELGSELKLSSDCKDATIYYTMDGTIPTKKSIKYTDPIIINSNTMIKALANHDDYNPSEIKTLNYNVTSLKKEQMFPVEGGYIYDYSIPAITFNKDLKKGPNFDKIKLSVNNENVLEKTIIVGNTIYFVPKTDVFKYSPIFTLIFPEGCVQTESGDSNAKINKIWSSSYSRPIHAYDIYAGSNTSSLLTTNGYLKYWGPVPNENGGFGIYNTIYLSDAHVKKTCSSHNAIAYIKEDNSLWMWGHNNWGCIGDGNKNNYIYRLFPHHVMDNVQEVSMGGAEGHTLALTSDNVLYGWGSNLYNQLTVDATDLYTQPVKLMDGIKQIHAGDRSTYVIKEDNSLWFWGNLEVDTAPYYVEYKTPIKIADDVLMVSNLSEYTPCYLKTDYSLWACGDNLKSSKVADDVIYIVGSKKRGMYIKSDNSLHGWGRNDYGQLGNGVIEDKKPSSDIYNPVKIMDNVKSVSIQFDYTLALTTDGNVWGWGQNRQGNINPENYDYNTSLIGDPRPTPEIIWKSKENYTLKDISLSLNKNVISINEQIPLLLELNPHDTNIDSIEWISDDENVAIVSNRGIVTGRSNGNTNINVIVKAGKNEYKSKISISVIKETGVLNKRTNTYKTEVTNKGVILKGVSLCEKISLYDVSGVLLYETVVHGGSSATIPINSKGIYVIKTSKGYSNKVIYP